MDSVEYFLDCRHGQQSRLIKEGLNIWEVREDGKTLVDRMFEEWNVEQMVMLFAEFPLDTDTFDKILTKYQEDLLETEGNNDLTDCAHLLSDLLNNIPDLNQESRNRYLNDIQVCKRLAEEIDSRGAS